MTTDTRSVVRLGSACDNACVFCGQHGAAELVRSRAEITGALGEARTSSSEVSLVGGEPMLVPELESIVAEARALGFARVGVQTNGRRPERVRALADAGLTDVHLSIHGATAAAHDYHTAVPGSFVAALSTLDEARAAGLEVVVTTVLTRSNARVLSELARLLVHKRASAWCLAVPWVRGRAAELHDRVVPRLGIVVPFALHAMSISLAAHVPTFVRGAPLCLLGPFAAHALPDEPRAHGEPCDGCEVRARCPGVDPTYLARFDGDELAKTSATKAARSSRFSRLFVGAGELAPPPTSAVHDAPTKARVALPMLGKVQPARAEVSRTVEKKSGAALRELFKDLFADPRPEEARPEGERD